MITVQEINDIEIRCNNATKGPWKSIIEGRDHESGDSFVMTGIENTNDIWGRKRGVDIYLTGATLPNQEFIAHARQDIPRLILEVRRLLTIY